MAQMCWDDFTMTCNKFWLEMTVTVLLDPLPTKRGFHNPKRHFKDAHNNKINTENRRGSKSMGTTPSIVADTIIRTVTPSS